MHPQTRKLIIGSLLCCLLAWGCADRPPAEGRCEDNVFLECRDEECTPVETCEGEAAVCDPLLGCVACAPGGTICVENNVHTCTASGTAGEFVEDCGICEAGACLSECELAAAADSYLGCEFMAVSTLNPELVEDFDNDFAIAVGNPDIARSVRVRVTRGTEMLGSRDIAPGETETFRLPMLKEITQAGASSSFTDGAYIVQSDLPVMAYQFNPLHFSMRSFLTEYSYSNDASLLLPVHAWDDDYRISTRPTWGTRSITGGSFRWIPGFAAIIASEDDTVVTITRQRPEAVDSGLEFEDDSSSVTLQRGDVLQVLSGYPEDDEGGAVCGNNGWPQEVASGEDATPLFSCSAEPYDLTGTTVASSKPVGIFGGHGCIFVPLESYACDHLEEMMLPIDRWGDSTVMTAPAHPDGIEYGTVEAEYTVLAHEDETTIDLSPAVVPAITLNAGETFTFLTEQDFYIESEKQFLVTQTLLGQTHLDSESGDPASGIGVPIFQTRESYTFLSPSTYTRSYLNIATAGDAPILLDGTTVEDWSTIAGTGYRVARVPIQGGQHLVASAADEGFTIVVYGYAPYTSYLYPGGLNLKSFLE